VHVDAARLIARISRECNVQKLIHFSSLNASLNPQVIYFKPSQFLITKVRFGLKISINKSIIIILFNKFLGEEAVKEEFNDAVIIRPSNIYGENDRFLFYYSSDYRRGLTSIPLWKKGEMTIKMPVHVSLILTLI